jgi:uncharacterized protein YjbI with pentapeptide repeats
MCDFESLYFDLKEQKNISYKCPHKKWEKVKKGEKAFCIFHSEAKDKDAGLFAKEFKKLVKSGKHVFCGFVFPGEFDVKAAAGSTATFSDAVFARATFLGTADFSSAEFLGQGGANFIGARFPAGCVFSGVNFTAEGGVDFRDTEFSGKAGAVFRMSTFSGKGPTNFSRASFVGAGGVDFTWAKFFSAGGTDFKLAEFTAAGMVDFHFAEFSGRGVNFNGAKFTGAGEANFSLVQFTATGAADFGSTLFANAGGANFSLAQFTGTGGVNFGGAKFTGVGGANFSLAQFTGSGRDNFSEAQFSGPGEVNFSKTRFFGDVGVDFSCTRFTNDGGVDFSGAQFSGETKVNFVGRTFFDGTTTDFRDVGFDHPENVTLEQADLSRCRFAGTDLSKVNLTDVCWTGRRYRGASFCGRLKVFDELFQEKGRVVGALEWLFHRIGIWEPLRKLLAKAAPKKDPDAGRIRSCFVASYYRLLTLVGAAAAPREKNHAQVYRLYDQLLENYKNARRPHEASDFAAGRMEMRRRERVEKPRIRLALWLYRLFSLYGERPLFPLVWLIVLFFFCGVVNLKFGIIPEAPDRIIIGPESLGRIVPGPEDESIAVLSPESIKERPDLIQYRTIPCRKLSTHEFWLDFARALSVDFNFLTKRSVESAYMLRGSPWAPMILAGEYLVALLFLVLFVAAVVRKFGRGP